MLSPVVYVDVLHHWASGSQLGGTNVCCLYLEVCDPSETLVH
jgi:hypothetical protein